MIKNRKKIIMSIILSLSFLSYFNVKCYALNEEDKLDKLIFNKNIQKKLQSNIKELSNILEIKKNKDSEIVSVSFVENNYMSKIDNEKAEVIQIEDRIKNLNKELEDSIIDSVRLEKSIEEEKVSVLEENNIEFVKGCWPLESYKDISSPYGYRIHPISKVKDFHRGIDIPAPKNTEILSSDDGIVVFSGMQNGYGNVVKIKHFDGKKTVYAHNTLNLVSEGDVVKKGQVIGKVGSTGDSTGNHVHFESIVNDKNINPIYSINK
ncbi:hypothetical protein CHF27_000525 [Romboutsia maritimum]|uniref:M23ase beta-sheet core domain-containing protein n=1 Tax=Romboutsia maritimum TaxID=2020948 RepID=A0A371IW67_9FIRM|nr:M23 family metallopeptidase [Romboutsia maritimum]RDY24717.1 hypothetical protein CHF27_000525 [Romboutsia maritimum]